MNIDKSGLIVTTKALENGLTYLGVLYRPGSILLGNEALSLVIMQDERSLTVIEFPTVDRLIDAIKEMMELPSIEAAWAVYSHMLCIDLEDDPVYKTADVQWTVNARRSVTAVFNLNICVAFVEGEIDTCNADLTEIKAEYRIRGGEWEVLHSIRFTDGPEYNTVNIDLSDAPGLEFELRMVLLTDDDFYISDTLVIPEADLSDAIDDAVLSNETPPLNLTHVVGETKPFRVVVTTVRGATMTYTSVTDVITEEDEYIIIRKNGDVHRLQKVEVLDLHEQRRK